MTILAKLLASFFWSIVVGLLAKRKNLNPWGWGVAGAASWFIALVFLAFQPYRCAKCKRVVDKNQMTDQGCTACIADTSHPDLLEAGETFVDSSRAPRNKTPEPSVFQTIFLPLLVLGAIAVAVVFALKPTERSSIEQKPIGVVPNPNVSSASTAQLPLSTNAPSAPNLDQAVFMASPDIDSPCKAIPGIHTVDDGVKYFFKKYGSRAVLARTGRTIKSTGQRVAMVELPTESAPALFVLMDGTLKQCSEFFDATKLKNENQHRQANLRHIEEWIRVGSTLDGARTDYVDAASIIKGGDGLIRLTVKQKFDPPQISAKGSEIVEARVALVLNCTESASAVSLLNQYDKNNTLLEHVESDKLQWIITAETDNSLRGTLLRSHCRPIGMRP
jgi:hypothetical protein